MDELRAAEDRDASLNNSSIQREGGQQEEPAQNMDGADAPAHAGEEADEANLLGENEKNMEQLQD